MRSLLLALAVVCLAAPAAGASFPGRNDDLVVAVEGCDRYHRYLATTPWTGGPLIPITEQCAQADATGNPGIEVHSPDASPDGQTIIASQEEDRYAPESSFRRFFTTLRPDGSARQYLQFPAGIDYAGGASFSPRGDRYAFDDDGRYSDSSIWATKLDGSDAWRIRKSTECGPPERNNCVAFLNPRWSPDGKLIAVVVENRQYNLREPFPVEPGIWLMRARDGRLMRRVAKHGGWVDWSPDGSKLVYGTPYRRSGTRASGGNLYVVSRNGGKARELVHRDAIAETDPAWSPDGRWISWISLRFEGGGDVFWTIKASLWRVRARGGRPQRIRSLPRVGVEEGEYNAPQLTWLPRPR